MCVCVCVLLCMSKSIACQFQVECKHHQKEKNIIIIALWLDLYSIVMETLRNASLSDKKWCTLLVLKSSIFISDEYFNSMTWVPKAYIISYHWFPTVCVNSKNVSANWQRLHKICTWNIRNCFVPKWCAWPIKTVSPCLFKNAAHLYYLAIYIHGLP